MSFEAGVEFLSSRLAVAGSPYVREHWDCKYLDVRVDMRTGSMLIQPGNAPPTDLAQQMRLAGYHEWASTVERLQTTLRGTCEACRGAATRALGEQT